MAIHESGENYLEQIFMLSKTMDKVRAIDLAQALGFSRPTVSVMLRELRDGGFVVTNDQGALSLTEKGEQVASKIYERHCLITSMLVAIGVPTEIAKKDACLLEHDVSEETLCCIRRFVAKEGKE